MTPDPALHLWLRPHAPLEVLCGGPALTTPEAAVDRATSDVSRVTCARCIALLLAAARSSHNP